jgi:hypothetical protein
MDLNKNTIQFVGNGYVPGFIINGYSDNFVPVYFHYHLTSAAFYDFSKAAEIAPIF